jgi:transposase
MNTNEPRLQRVEVVADLPVLWATLQRLDLPATLDRIFPTPLHFKCLLSPGEVLSVWLLFVLSQADHCLNHVLPWVAQHQLTLSSLLGKSVLPIHFHDDRLADWLDRLAAGGAFATLEEYLNAHTIRVYHLGSDLVRIDTTTNNSYCEVLSEQGLLQFGHSKDDPDRPQLKIATAVLDPLGMPLATAVVAGNTSDDPLYVPAIAAVRQSLGTGGRTYVGDCKMAALASRAFVAAGADFYLCPLSEKQLGSAERNELLRGVFLGTVPLQEVSRPTKEGEPDELVAEGFCVDVELTATVDGQEVRWTERRWLVRSVAYAQGQQQSLQRRLAKAESEVAELVKRKRGKKQLFHAELMAAAEAIVKREGVEGLLDYQAQALLKTVKKRAYRDRPARQQSEVYFEIEVQRNEEAIEQKSQQMGWQVYATNAVAMSLGAVVWAYRGQYRIEDDFSRLKGRPLGLSPMYLQNENRMAGLVYLLSLALRVLTILEWSVREKLQQAAEKLQDIYAGQPKRQTARPSAELLLGALKTISVSVVEVNGQTYALLTPLTDLHKRLLLLWDLPPDLYESLVRAFPLPPPNTSEP